MEELALTPALLSNIRNWMQPKYAILTINNRTNYLKHIFRKYKVLNKETFRAIMKTIKHQHQRACLVMINSYCYDNDIDFHIRVPSIKKQPQKLPELLSAAEIRLMIEVVPKPYDLAIRCIFNMGAGLRVSEIIKLSWNHIRWVDWLENQDNYGVALIKSGKGSKDRPVNIPKNLMHDLYEYAKEQEVLNEMRIPVGNMIFQFGEIKEDRKKDLEFLQDEEKKAEYVRIKYDWFRYNIIKQKCEKALNKKIKVHSLRHSRATYLYEIESVPVEKLQTLLGHSSLNTTMLYVKINPRSVFETIKNTTEL